MKFDVGDSVEIISINTMQCGEVGTVTKVVGPNVYVKTPQAREAQPYCTYELRHSQQKLPLDEDAAIEREVRLEEEMNADLIERRNVRGITPPDY